MSRFLPRSLLGQMLLSVALALLMLPVVTRSAEVVLLLAGGVLFGPSFVGWIEVDDSIALLRFYRRHAFGIAS